MPSASPPARDAIPLARPSALLSGWRVLRNAAMGFMDHQAPTRGAAIAYYTLFSMAPMLLIAIAVAGAVFGEEAARGEIFRQLAGMLGVQGAAAVEGLLASVQTKRQGLIGSLIGLALLLLGATTVFAELQAALDQVWTEATRKAGRPAQPPWWSLLRARLLAFGLILATGFLLMVSLLAGAALAAIGQWWQGRMLGWEAAAEAAHVLLSTGMSVALFALMFRFLPSVRVPWRHVWLGAAVTAALFALGRHAIGWYIGTAAIGSAYGAAGSLVVVLVWVYGSAQVFLFGAELTRAVSEEDLATRHRQADAIQAPPDPATAPPAPTAAMR